ncbi:YoaK family protein [uncultured Ruminococcus sp.]|uniref:YoaK family protein n=1 Tax=uncultured Ruminococcus sp. TaxID=165186 RepID=UPI00292CC019|nr:YoaK family protein [uncultured Ruminococcus sp.]
MQTSESFRLSAVLSFSGGLQDAYTYNVRDGVFANAQTGNVVLMSQNFMSGDPAGGLRYMLPLLSFALGIFAAERIEHFFKEKNRIHWRQIVILIEAFVLAAVGFMPREYHMVANMLVSFTCAMQVQTFRKVHGFGYASTMCIGNLRSGTESLSQFMRTHEKPALYKALHFFGIILIFAIGAGVGGMLSGWLGIRTIWISVALLLIAGAMMFRESWEGSSRDAKEPKE